MNIKQAKEEIKHTVQAYLSKDAFGEYKIPAVRQRPVLLIGPPGIGKTQIMEQIARECEIGLVAYTITHHTRQSAFLRRWRRPCCNFCSVKRLATRQSRRDGSLPQPEIRRSTTSR